jgi:hypothetical protein
MNRPSFGITSLQALPHKLPLRKAQPPLTRRLAPSIIQPPQQPARQLLSNLPYIPSQRLGLGPIPRPLKRLIQRKPRLPRQAELLEREVRERLLCGTLIHVRPDLGQAVGKEERAVDEQPVGGAVDLEVAEEGVGAEEGEDFIDDVVGFRVRVDVERGGGWGEVWECVGGAARFGAEREEGEVAYEVGTRSDTLQQRQQSLWRGWGD